MADKVRVRYAPSPTGVPHIGNIRTALFNWLYARHMGGKFIVRIEDTDVARTVEGATEAILDGLRWLGLDWDEGPEVDGDYGPYFQSQRLTLYKQIAEKLVEQGDAYYCYCSPERLTLMRQEQEARKEPPKYDRHCRFLTPEQRDEYEKRGVVPVVRFAVPLEGTTTFNDIIRGDVSFENRTLDDFIMIKSDGYPTYHLANIVDDHFMETSHVMRGDEWISSTPRHVLMYRALGWEPPAFAHLPIILGPDKSKLSKRHGATSITQYIQEGYLPDALVNFMALLGWSLDDKTEFMSRQTLIENFSIERIGKTGAVFSMPKLDWMNGIYIRQLSTEELAEEVIPILERDLPESVERPLAKDYVIKIVPLVHERLKKLREITEVTDFFFTENLEYDSASLIGKGMDKESTLNVLQVAYGKLDGVGEFSHDELEQAIRPLAEDLNLKTGQLFGVLRVAVTGRSIAPPLFETMAVLGKERSLKRIRAAIVALKD